MIYCEYQTNHIPHIRLKGIELYPSPVFVSKTIPIYNASLGLFVIPTPYACHRHDMATFSALLTPCEGTQWWISHKRAVMRSVDISVVEQTSNFRRNNLPLYDTGRLIHICHYYWLLGTVVIDQMKCFINGIKATPVYITSRKTDLLAMELKIV